MSDVDFDNPLLNCDVILFCYHFRLMNDWSKSHYQVSTGNQSLMELYDAMHRMLPKYGYKVSSTNATLF